MGIDILSLQPNVISRDLRHKYVMIYGKPKSGKTTAAASFPNSILLAFEKGYNAISGVLAQDITKWSDAKLVLRQLEKPEAKAKFETVIIDTVPIAWDYVEQYICAQNSVSKISDISWGSGFSACKKEFESFLRKITLLGYGVVLISHSVSRIEKDQNGNEVEIISPDMPKRAAEICNSLVDLIGYIGTEYTETGEARRYLYTRETPRLFAGSRWKYMEPKIPFGYNELVKAVSDAIEKAERLDGAKVTEVEKTNAQTYEKHDFNATMSEAREIWTSLVNKAQTDEDKTDIVRTMSKKVEMIFGRKMKLSEVTEDQVDLLYLALLDLRDLRDSRN